MYTEMWFGRYKFGSCSITVTDMSIAKHVTHLLIYVVFFSFCVYYGIKWLYILSINIIFMNGTSGCINPSLIFKLYWEWPTGSWTHHQLYRLHCENSSYNYNLKACLNSLFCKRKQCVLNNNDTIIAAELLLLKLPPTYSCPSVKECYSFVWCHCFFWIQPYLQLFLGMAAWMHRQTTANMDTIYLAIR